MKHNFANHEEDAFFGVFDGHGRDGGKCAQFVRNHLPTILAKAIDKGREQNSSQELNKEITHDIISKAHTECNKRMHVNQDLDDSLSGTTSISIYLHGKRNRITIANVGDSRAVIGRANSTTVNNSSTNDDEN